MVRLAERGLNRDERGGNYERLPMGVTAGLRETNCSSTSVAMSRMRGRQNTTHDHRPRRMLCQAVSRRGIPSLY